MCPVFKTNTFLFSRSQFNVDDYCTIQDIYKYLKNVFEVSTEDKKKHSRKIIYGNNDPIKSCVNIMHEKVCDVTHIITRPNFNNKRLQIVFGIQI